MLGSTFNQLNRLHTFIQFGYSKTSSVQTLQRDNDLTTYLLLPLSTPVNIGFLCFTNEMWPYPPIHSFVKLKISTFALNLVLLPLSSIHCSLHMLYKFI